jgi:hypothetical protein
VVRAMIAVIDDARGDGPGWSCRFAGEISHWCREGAAKDSVRNQDPDAGEDDETRRCRSQLYCALCGHAITSEAEKIEMNGDHRHTFFNPAGIVYELGCFHRAPGCLIGEEISADFTWFAGYVWSLALCGSCLAHLGWCFSSDSTSFFGLIGKNLRRG